MKQRNMPFLSSLLQNTDVLWSTCLYLMDIDETITSVFSCKKVKGNVLPFILSVRALYLLFTMKLNKITFLSKMSDYVISPNVVEWAIKFGCDFRLRDCLCRHAASNGSLDTIIWARNQFPIYNWGPEVLNEAVKNGHLQIVVWLRNQTPPCPWSDNITTALSIQYNHLEIIQWLRSQTPPCPWDETSCLMAAKYDRRDILQWMLFPPTCAYSAGMFSVAAEAGNLPLIQWLHECCPFIPWDVSVCSAAARIGSLEILHYLRISNPPCPLGESVCADAAGKNQLEVIKWLRWLDPPCPWDSRTSYAAAINDNLEVLEWISNQNPPCPWSSSTCSAAAQGGSLRILQWLRAQHPPCPWDRTTCYSAAMSGHLEVLKWLLQQDPPCPWDYVACGKIADLRGHAHIVDFILNFEV